MAAGMVGQYDATPSNQGVDDAQGRGGEEDGVRVEAAITHLPINGNKPTSMSGHG